MRPCLAHSLALSLDLTARFLELPFILNTAATFQNKNLYVNTDKIAEGTRTTVVGAGGSGGVGNGGRCSS